MLKPVKTKGCPPRVRLVPELPTKPVDNGVGVAAGVGAGVGVAVGAGVGDAVGSGVGFAVGDGLAVGDGVRVGVGEAVAPPLSTTKVLLSE
jgi:hypothetical protein